MVVPELQGPRHREWRRPFSALDRVKRVWTGTSRKLVERVIRRDIGYDTEISSSQR